MDRLHRHFVKRGDLVFDVGAHVGDRVASFRRMGAKVLAIEPQPAVARTLRVFYGADKSVVIVETAVGRKVGNVRLMINVDNPTVSTASDAFVNAARDADGWREQQWNESIRVPMTTLDALIAEQGVPVFIKIDVEGFEEEVLLGLTQPVQALSFEFTTIQREVAQACLDRCTALGFDRFNAALGESQQLGEWRSGTAMADWLTKLPHDANSGDIYAQMG
jgi:FkbM family methyltransferase